MLKRFCRNHVLFVVVCLITLELPITSVCQLEVGVEESTVKGYLERGKRYIEMELYDQAITEFHQILQINLNHSETYYCLGNAYRYQNMIDKAVDAYQRVLALKASKKIHGLTYLHLGILYDEQGKFSDAEKYSDHQKNNKICLVTRCWQADLKFLTDFNNFKSFDKMSF